MRSPSHLLVAAAGMIAATQAGAASANGGESGSGMHLIAMDELDVPIVDGARSDGRLRLKLVLQAADAPAAARITLDLPALREISLAAAVEFARLYATPFAPVDAQRLVRDMTRALRAHDRTIAAVLLVQVAAVRS